MRSNRPSPSEYGQGYAAYISKVPDGDVVSFLDQQLTDSLKVLRSVDEARAHTPDAPYTWTLAQVLGHLIDAERIFAYRALRFARADATPLPSFEENDYAVAAESDRPPFADLVSEFEYVRRSNILMLKNLPPAAWSRSGMASNTSMTVNALAYSIAGHVEHHMAIVRKRLGIA
jgi:DinB superfamily